MISGSFEVTIVFFLFVFAMTFGVSSCPDILYSGESTVQYLSLSQSIHLLLVSKYSHVAFVAPLLSVDLRATFDIGYAMRTDSSSSSELSTNVSWVGLS